jgi:hypothetical protein
MKRLALLLIMVTVLATLAGCATADSTRPGTAVSVPTKAGDGVVRHDLEPLISRIPALAGIEAATWSSGTLGDARAPGPSTYWIDAIVTLSPQAADELRSSLSLNLASGSPNVASQLSGALPSGELMTGPGLNEKFSAGSWHIVAHLQSHGEVLVLEAVGE